MKKILTAIILLALTVYLAGNYWLNAQAEIYAPKLQASLEAYGIEFENFDYNKLSIRSFNAIVVHDIEASFLLNRPLYGRENININLDVDKLIVRNIDLSEKTVRITLDDFDIEVISIQGQKVDSILLTNATFEHETPIDMATPDIALKALLEQLGFLLNGQGATGVTLSGTTVMVISNKMLALDVETVTMNSQVYLSFDPDDVTAAAEVFGFKLGPEEAEVIARHPNQVPAMIEITRDAKDKSRALGRNDKDFPEDAYRHVYWSYHLSRALGPELAKEITDAHETVTGNTSAERAMDFHNNEVARTIAGRKLSDNQLIQFVLTSDQVIRQPGEN